MTWRWAVSADARRSTGLATWLAESSPHGVLRARRKASRSCGGDSSNQWPIPHSSRTATWWREHSRTSIGREFPPECRDADYETRIKAAYPIHPEIFDRLYTDWSTLVKFQRTHGVLRLMAAVIHSLRRAQPGSRSRPRRFQRAHRAPD
jgi:hypothetical protein